VTDGQVMEAEHQTGAPAAHYASLVVAVVLGGALAGCAYAAAVALLAAIAVLQALFLAAWFLVVAPQGRRGAVTVLLLAAAAADVVVARWAHARLSALLPVLGLAVPALFVHQLTRGVARVKLVESLAASGFGALAVIALPAFLQLRHEFTASGSAGKVAAAATGAAVAALAGALLADMVVAAPRFDPEVPRGLAAVVVAGLVGGSVGYLILRSVLQFQGGRSAFVGACCGVLTALFSVAADFALHAVPPNADPWAQRARPAFAVLLALCLVAPAAFLVCLAVRA
jgi:hypothetical protein